MCVIIVLLPICFLYRKKCHASVHRGGLTLRLYDLLAIRGYARRPIQTRCYLIQLLYTSNTYGYRIITHAPYYYIISCGNRLYTDRLHSTCAPHIPKDCRISHQNIVYCERSTRAGHFEVLCAVGFRTFQDGACPATRMSSTLPSGGLFTFNKKNQK